MSLGRLPERLAEEIQRRYCSHADQVLPSERRLSALLGASRAMVREALAILRARGQIGGVQGQPAMVRMSFSDPQSLEALEARTVLEGEIAAIAALRAGPTGYARLREDLRAMFLASSPDEYWRCESALHTTLLQVAQNSVLASLTEPLLDAAYALPAPRTFEDRRRAHQRLVAAIGRAQPQLARDLLTDVVAAQPLAPTSSG